MRNKKGQNMKTLTKLPEVFPYNIAESLDVVAGTLGKALFERYLKVINDYRLGVYDMLAVDAGKFVEEYVNTVASLEGIEVNNKKGVSKNINKILETIRRQGRDRQEDKRNILEIAYHSIYLLRNTRDAAHSNSTPITSWDARHIVETATWLLQELMRIYGDADNSYIENLFYPFAYPGDVMKIFEYVEGKIIPIRGEFSVRDLVLAILMQNEDDCLYPKEIISRLPNSNRKTVYHAIKHLKDNLYIIESSGQPGCYKITTKGRQRFWSKVGEQIPFLTKN